MEPLVFKGEKTSAWVYAHEIEAEAITQIYAFLASPVFADAKIRIMPDCHSGSGAVIGFTCPVGDKVIPNVIGVDIGCGVATMLIKVDSFEEFDKKVRVGVPCGFAHRQSPHKNLDKVFLEYIETRHGFDLKQFKEDLAHIGNKIGQTEFDLLNQVGTLGGGNHFIELDKEDGSEHLYLTVHTGSRNFGLRIAEYHQKKAQDIVAGGNRRNELAWLEGANAQEYLYDMRVAQRFARLNRLIIMHELSDGRIGEVIESVHNFIDDTGMIRKGAVSARAGERVIIPWNMRDGLIIGTGLGNEDWNCSAPHGAGRKMSRGQAKRTLSVDDFQAEMDAAGVWSSCIGKNTLDEAPGAYKDSSEVREIIGETVDIELTLKPVYNFKAGKD